jgi:uracil-DNA glycosylase
MTKLPPGPDLFSRLDPEPPVPERAPSLPALNATFVGQPPPPGFAERAVPGEGPVGAAIAFVGEQPGDQEDLQGRPFVGPAGQLFDRALAEAGIDRSGVYVTNAVKHFKFVARGTRRIHEKPTAGDVTHYRWWLEQEIDFVSPRVVVAMGATALLALSSKALPLLRSRGPMRFANRQGYVTVHPSYLLRLPPGEDQKAAYAAFVGDLGQIGALAN